MSDGLCVVIISHRFLDYFCLMMRVFGRNIGIGLCSLVFCLGTTSSQVFDPQKAEADLPPFVAPEFCIVSVFLNASNSDEEKL